MQTVTADKAKNVPDPTTLIAKEMYRSGNKLQDNRESRNPKKEEVNLLRRRHSLKKDKDLNLQWIIKTIKAQDRIIKTIALSKPLVGTTTETTLPLIQTIDQLISRSRIINPTTIKAQLEKTIPKNWNIDKKPIIIRFFKTQKSYPKMIIMKRNPRNPTK